MINLDWIAGAIDCDGSISITAKRFSPVVNFRQLEYSRPVMEEIQVILGGKIYDHAGTNLRMLTWQTTTHEETKRVCEILIPHLVFKKRQAQEVIRAIDLWDSTKGTPRGVGFTHPQWVKDEIKKIADSLNINNQTETSRRNKNRVAIEIASLANT